MIVNQKTYQPSSVVRFFWCDGACASDDIDFPPNELNLSGEDTVNVAAIVGRLVSVEWDPVLLRFRYGTVPNTDPLGVICQRRKNSSNYK